MNNTLQWIFGHILLTLLIIFVYPSEVHWLRTGLALVIYVIGSIAFWICVDDNKIKLPGFGDNND